ncbi:MAG: WD40 repeat domain-containing protein, partial [Pirellulaceae bacterium]
MPCIKTIFALVPLMLAIFGCALHQAQAQELRLPDHMNVIAVKYSEDGESIISLSTSTKVFVRVWNARTGNLESELPLETDVHGNRFLICTPRLSGDGKLAVACPGGIAQVWDTETGKGREIALRENIGISHMAISPDGSLVAMVHGGFLGGGRDVSVSVWDVTTGLQLHAWRHTGGLDLKDVAFSRDGKLVCTASQENGAMVWDVESGALVRHIQND